MHANADKELNPDSKAWISYSTLVRSRTKSCVCVYLCWRGRDHSVQMPRPESGQRGLLQSRPPAHGCLLHSDTHSHSSMRTQAFILFAEIKPSAYKLVEIAIKHHSTHIFHCYSE